MAKKEKKDKSKEVESEKGKGSKIIGFLVVLFIILIWLGIFGVLIKLNVGGFGNSILRPLLKDIPIVNMILPDSTEDETDPETIYTYQTLEEAIARINELEALNESLSTEDPTIDSELVSELQAEIERLKVFEDNQLAFEERVAEFERNVVFAEAAPDIEEYKAYYESINPTNAEEIYRQVVEQLQFSEAITEKADIYSKMKPANAASILEIMTADIDSVAQMLLAMKPAESSAILAAMDPTAAAKITKKMLDLDAEKLSGN